MNPIFVYGILKGRRDAQAGIVRNYRLVDMGWFPAAIPCEGGAIVGELIFVDDGTVEEFDMIEGHPNFYIRTDVEVEVGDGNNVELVHAQMYVINEAYQDRQSVPTGSLSISEDSGLTKYEYHA